LSQLDFSNGSKRKNNVGNRKGTPGFTSTRHHPDGAWYQIKTVKMTYKVYRFIGLNPVSSAHFMVINLIRGIKKYKRIYGAS
jgi:hypothetical protein